MMRAVRGWFWGPGVVLAETDYLTKVHSREASRAQVIALITGARNNRILECCYEAWMDSTEYADAWVLHDEMDKKPR